MTRIGGLFDGLKRDGRKGLLAYLTALGDDVAALATVSVNARRLRFDGVARATGLLPEVRGGADLIELGVPFSDPIADGPVIQRAGERALLAGTTLGSVLEIAAEIRRRSEVPLLLFTYLNPVLRYGLERLAADAARQGIDGCLLTDASVDEAQDYAAAMHRHGLDTVFLAAPTSTPRRLELVARYSTGFIYLVSRTGVTGEREQLSDSVAPLVRAVRAVTDLPLAVGFGISRPEHVAELARQVEAVVVGSAFVRLIERHAGNSSLEIQLERFTRELKHGFGVHA